MTRVPRRHGDRHGESKDTSTKISNFRSLSVAKKNHEVQWKDIKRR
jgi:hypothetical protein